MVANWTLRIIMAVSLAVIAGLILSAASARAPSLTNPVTLRARHSWPGAYGSAGPNPQSLTQSPNAARRVGDSHAKRVPERRHRTRRCN